MKPPRLKSPRLLPIVIFAAVALLAFKGIGLVTSGGYVLSGTQPAQAADAAPAATNGTAPATSGSEPTLADTNPTLADTAPTLGGTADPIPPPASGSDAASSPEPAATAAPAPVTAVTTASTAAIPSVAAAPAASGTASALACPPDSQAGATNCGPAVASAADAVAAAAACGPSATERTVLDRLSQRRQELDKLAASLGMRETLVKAAEQQMQQRADALKALQQQIADLQSQKKSMEDAQFASIVKMYETMKPQEAAGIFDGLDMDVLIRVAQAMDARKMSPILAKMVSTRAQQLTMQLADTDQSPSDGPAAADANALPQIVGQ